MKPKFRSLITAFAPLSRSSLIVVASLCAANSASAASQTWDGDTDATWATVTNWVSNTGAPGSTTVSSNDIATFNSALVGGTRGGSADPIVLDAQRIIGGITYDTASVGSYQIGTTAGGQFQFQLTALTSAANLTQITAGVTSPQVIATPIFLRNGSGSNNPTYTFRNNATSPSATLGLTGAQTWNGSGSRPTFVILDGSNSGDNIISGIINNPAFGQGGTLLTKNGTGTWILSAANVFTGTASSGIAINGGILSARNASALGSGASNNKVAINNTGTLQLASGITLIDTQRLNLNEGGTIQSSGSNATNAPIAVGAAATSVTLSTVNAGDVFTVGNAANDFTGGTSASVVHITGPGTVFLAFASNYAGSLSVDAGTLSLGAVTALGTPGGVNVVSGAKVQTLGNNVTLASLTGTGAVSNGTAATVSSLNANIASANTFAGQLQNGVDGTLGLTKTGAGTLTLSGVSNYTEATTISTGALNLTGSLGNTAVSGGSGATLSGTGTITGGVTVDSGVHIAPGDGGDAALGTLTTGTLALNADSQLDFGITNTTTLDKITVTALNGLSITGGQLNINGGLSAFTTIGTYPLIAHPGAAISGINSLLTVNGLNKSVTRTYTFTDVGGFVNLVVANSGVTQTFWNVNADGNWSTNSNWTPATAPNAVGAFAGFGGGGTEITADRTITVNGAFTVGTLAFNGAANARSYTLAAGGGANITLDNGASGAAVTDTSGNHTIDSPLTLTGNGATFAVINIANTLTIGGSISGDGTPLIKAGPGTLALNGINIYTNGTTINAGTLLINSADSLGDPLATTTVNAGTLRATADITNTGIFVLGDSASAISVAPGTTYTLAGQIADGANVGILNKADTGTLVLSNSNSYSGGTVINAGTVQVNNANSLGAAAGAVTLNNATLQATATFTGTRNITLGSASSTISVDPSQTYTVNGAISGTGTLNKTGGGTLSLGSTTNNYSGGTVISSGILAVNFGSFLGPGTLTFQGGTLQNNYGNNNTYGLGNPIFVGAGQVGTINMNNRMSITGAVSGSGTLNVNLNTTATRDDLNNSWTGFTGQVNFAGNGTARLLNNSGTFNTASFTSSSVDVSGNAFLQPVTNSNGNTYPIGALSGSSATAGFAGGTAGTATLSVGALNTSTTFAGQINGNNALTKVGTGTLTLSGANGYTGNTSLQGGALVLADNASLTFRPGATGVTNSISGTGSLPLTLDGDFTMDLTNPAALVNGGSWVLVNVATFPANPFSASFTVTGFTQSADVWTLVDGGKTWTFTESTGTLSLVLVGYSGWAAINAGGQESSADFDNDGVPNGVEYFMNSAAGFTATPALNGSNTISWTNGGNISPAAYGTEFVVQTSNDLSAWTDVPVGDLASNTAGSLSYTLTGTAPRFVRLRVKPN